MSLAFIISAYRRPDLVGRLVKALAGRPCAIHVDAKVDPQPFAAAVGQGQAGQGQAEVAWLASHLCHWGFFGHVEASLKGLRWFVDTDARHVVLLTGQCYPLRRIGDIEGDLARMGHRSMISHAAFPHPDWAGGGYNRVRDYHLRALGRAVHVKARRELPLGLQPYGGSSYWCLSRRAAEYVLDFVDRHPEVERYFRHAWIPDEMFFQTILANSPLRDSLIDTDVHYIEWTPHSPSPHILSSGERALASGKWFARKFEDCAVLDQIDAVRLASPTPARSLEPAFS